VQGVAAGGDYAAASGLYLRYGMDDQQGGQPVKRIDGRIAGPIFTYSSIKIRRVEDGLSKTVAVGERHIPSPDPQTGRPLSHMQGDTAFFAADNPYTIFAESQRGLANGKHDKSGRKFGSAHPSIVQFTFLDGHVEPVSSNLDDETLMRLTIIADGNQAPVSSARPAR
jgi:prepilin-type processing-associated H-X9-DG protein